MSLCRFEAFGIRVNYLPQWRVIPDQSHLFDYSSGFIRFEERPQGKVSQLSFGLRWEYSETTNEEFLEEFRQKIRQESEKKLRGKKSGFRVLRDELAESETGVPICMMETEYADSQALFKRAAAMKKLRVCNSAFYSDTSHRFIICSLITTPERLEQERELYERLLRSAEALPVMEAQEEEELVKQFRKGEGK